MAITTIPEVREEIQNNIKTNNQREITGQVLQDTLIDMLDTVDEVKANTTGYYEGMSVGLADNLISPDTENDSASWLYRSTAGDQDVSSGFATIEGMKGNTIVWNQLVGKNNFGIRNGIEVNTENMTLTFLGISGDTYFQIKDCNIKDHTYLLSFEVTGSETDVYNIENFNYTYGIPQQRYNSKTLKMGYNFNLFTSPVEGANMMWDDAVKPNGPLTITLSKIMLFDLTKMFGSDSGIVSALGLSSVDEITTDKAIAAFERLFPESYYAYDAGSLLSFNPTDMQTTGFNQYDNSKQTGNVHVLAEQKYRIKGARTGLTYSDGTDVTITDGYFTPDRVDYLTLSGGNNVDTCVHLSWSGYRDGDDDYEKYWSVNTDLSWIRTLEHNGSPLFPNGLCGVGEVYDEISGGKAIKRIGSVDLGTLDWQKDAQNRMLGLRDIGSKYISPTVAPNILCAKYEKDTSANTYSNVNDKRISLNSSSNPVVYDSAYTDAATFKAAMSGVMLYYELATPIVVDLPEGINLNYRMDDFGTEEFINTTAVSNTPGLCKPTLVDIGYQTNLRDKIRRLDDNYVSFTVDQTESTNSEKKRQAQENIGLPDLMLEKANVSGSYPLITAGNLISDASISRQFFHDKTAGEGNEIGAGYANVNNIKGNTIVWNQNISGCVDAGGLTITQLDNGIINMNGTATNAYFNPFITKWGQAAVAISKCPIGKYFMYVKIINNPDNIGLKIRSLNNRIIFTYNTSDFTKSYSAIGSCTSTSASGGFGMADYGGIGIEFNDIKIQVSLFNITQMFGAGNEPSTIEEFESIFPSEYYPYDEGTLVSLNPTQVVSTGFNLWDEQWELGEINSTTGQNVVNNDSIRSVNYIPLLPNQTYYIRSDIQTVGWVRQRFYDENKDYIGYAGQAQSNGLFTPPSNAHFMRFFTYPNATTPYGNVYRHDICVNLSDTSRNGTYLPYQQDSTDLSWIQSLTYTPEGASEPVQLFPNGLCSVGAAYDEVTPSKAVKRIGQLTIDGTEGIAWAFWVDGSGVYYLRQSQVYDKFSHVRYKGGTGILMNRLRKVPQINATITTATDFQYSKWSDATAFLVLSLPNVTTSDAVNEWIQANGPLIINYELAEPIEVPLNHTIGYAVQPGGTEQLLPENEPGTTPITSEIKMDATYPLNAVGTIQNLPYNYMNERTLDSLISALNTAVAGYSFSKTTANGYLQITATATSNS